MEVNKNFSNNYISKSQKFLKNKVVVLDLIRRKVKKCIDDNKPIPVFNNLISIVSNLDVLILAYRNIKSNQGSMKSRIVAFESNKIVFGILQHLSNKLKNKTYGFLGVSNSRKLVNWNKRNLKSYSDLFLSMADFESQIVQEVLKLILNAIYEPIFEITDSNYGCRENLQYHDAILNIKAKVQGMDYAIECNMKEMFGTLDYYILLNQLQKYINDKYFLNLIYNCCKTGILKERQEIEFNLTTSVIEDKVLSSLLWNIYMLDFDNFIHTHIQQSFDILNNKKNVSITINSSDVLLYKRLLFRRKILVTRLRQIKNGKQIKKLPSKIKNLLVAIQVELDYYNQLLLKIKSRNQKTIRLKFHYIRYLDMWIFFTNAESVINKLIINKSTSYLKDYLKLTFSEKKIKFIDLRTERLMFLGFSITKLSTSKIILSKNESNNRLIGHKVHIGINKDGVLNWLLSKGYIDYRKQPREQPGLTTLSDCHLIMRYNFIIKNYFNFYAPLIDSKSTLNYLVYIFEYSCYKTFCHKYRTTISKLLLKYGKPFTVICQNAQKIQYISLLTSKSYWQVLKPRCDFILHNWKYKKKN